VKSQRRHELKENVLAKDLGKAGDFIKKNMNTILAVLAGIVVLIAAAIWIVTNRQHHNRVQWQDYQRLVLQMSQPEQFSELRAAFLGLAQNARQDELAGWAYLKAGETAYQELLRGFATLSQADRDRLTGEAHDNYSEVINSLDNHPARANAFLNLGLLAETRGDMAEARKLYDQAIQTGGGKQAQLAADQAQGRLMDLDRFSQPVVMVPGNPPQSESEIEPEIELTPTTAPDTQPTETQPVTTEG
jgi:tetratricopeptide (TPR) repeat protein